MNLQKKIARIKILIARLEAGGTVSTRALARVLTKDQMNALEADWLEEKSLRKIAKPFAIKRYEAMIKTALLLYFRAEKSYGTKPSERTVTARYHKAEYAFEAAIMYLEEITSLNPDLMLWIDRNLSDASYDPYGIPRVIGSTSTECKDPRKVPYPMLTKRQVKILALEEALEALEDKPLVNWYESHSTNLQRHKELCFDGFKF